MTFCHYKIFTGTQKWKSDFTLLHQSSQLHASIKYNCKHSIQMSQICKDVNDTRELKKKIIENLNFYKDCHDLNEIFHWYQLVENDEFTILNSQLARMSIIELLFYAKKKIKLQKWHFKFSENYISIDDFSTVSRFHYLPICILHMT